ncbi:HAMP domain-containing histidine kinase [Deferribacter autotrophicus]|uniref:histidine kinase n=1 Tax=Deferribacter autotrophicus TaxID=500465 RepID=A0A5A8F2W3_9BACT|nr:ATP-binding protein [Deferribacter autotrophicus]KAA0258143.1 HAMP domain-containing histidine kinase [Deferribacter autotrophicus]
MRINLSLKWKLIIFYFFLGMLPLILISFYSSYIASKSINRITEKQINELIVGISNQIVSTYDKMKGDIFQMADNPMIQLSFLQFKYGQRMNMVRDKLALYRSNNKFYERITLFTGDGEPVLTVPSTYKNLYEHVDKLFLREVFNYDFYLKEDLVGDKFLVMIKRVYDFEDNTLPVGLLVFEVPANKVLAYFINLDLGYKVSKVVENTDGKIIYKTADTNEIVGSKVKIYKGEVPFLNWVIKLGIPENVLFNDVYELRNKSLIFSIIVSFVAFIVALYFVQRFLKPIKEIIYGTEKFSHGDFDYEIKLKSGKELKILAEAINKMAKRLQKRQNELIQANKLASLGLLAAGIAHEVKNPLAGIRATIQLIYKRSNDTNVKNMAENVISEIDRLNKIVVDLLQFSKPDEIHKERCLLDEIIEKSINLVRKKMDEKRITILKSVENCYVIADCDHLLHIIINILLNAISAVEDEKGEIKIIGRVSGSKYILEICDNGIGISEDKIEHIFDPFFSLKEDGTGLGLSIVYTLMQKNGIKYEIKSKKGEGTVLKLIFEDFINEKHSDS